MANPYVYAGDDPVNQVDPSGRFSFGCNLAVAINSFEAGLTFGGFITFLSTTVLALAGTIAAASAALGPVALAFAGLGLSGLIAIVGFLAAYEIAQAIITIQGACSS